MMPTDTSPAGRAFIERYEGRVLHTYLDQRGIMTIGIGITGPEAWPGRVITDAECDEMFARKLDLEYEPGVLRAVQGAPTTQAQFDAMVSFAFNLGVGAFAGSSICRAHVAGEYEDAAANFLKWDKVRNKAGRLVYSEPHHKRRQAEADMYRGGGVPAAGPGAYDRYRCAKAMQQALSQAGLYAGRIDGAWGPLSRAAYKRFEDGR